MTSLTKWQDELKKTLVKIAGDKKGHALARKYAGAFPHSYIDDYMPDIVAGDIAHMEELSAENPLTINFYRADEATKLHLRLFQWQESIPLSDILPTLENLDLRTDSEHPYKVTLQDGQVIWISDLIVTHARNHIDLAKAKDLFQDAFSNIFRGLITNDGFNKLVLCALLTTREIAVLRMYAKYLKQIGFRFSHAYIEKALTNNPTITRDLVSLFMARFDPALQKKSKEECEKITKRILDALENVPSLDEDSIIRRLVDLMKATLRTNYFQMHEDKGIKNYLSIKLKSDEVPELPLPKPMYEIFVYAPHFEGIHLRNTKVARGGIRWSDRLEDFRTEVLGLMKAQTVKNAIIVPSGAKGGFVLKTNGLHEVTQAMVVDCYKNFMRGLLDLTDNVVDGEFVRPHKVVCYDEADPYLVVAADKGTSTFSDIANELAAEYKFWLDDAFASGGAVGYDHKKMGITAKGAWESIKRHFNELAIDLEKTPITMVGIGDMSGDVFGNGALYDKNIQLIAAFDHRDIFLDPTPDTKTAYKERERLFNLPRSSWQDYNPKLISTGGGVFKRTQKSIVLTPQVKKALDINDHALSPNELIQAILRAPVDLLFNGGIGTYVKASTQTHDAVGDRTNDYCRVDGKELRAKVVGEGGNLGFTQLGRIEYALNGGLINTDSIDNSAGVDCSDHEVNLKILLTDARKSGHLSDKKRAQLIFSVTDEIAQLVLQDNYNQALAMSFAAHLAKDKVAIETNYINDLEAAGLINRKVEYLPDNKELMDRKAAGQGLTRPELAVLLAYTKINLKHELLKTNVPEDPYLSKVLSSGFPPAVWKKYHHAMQNHLLKRDIIATQLSNHIVNEMGITFVYRLQLETGATVAEIVRAHAVAMHIFDTIELQREVSGLHFNIPAHEQNEILANIRKLLELATRWFLHTNHLDKNIEPVINHYAPRIQQLSKAIPELMTGATKQYADELAQRFLSVGLSQELAERIAAYRAVYAALNVIQVATEHKFDLMRTAHVYFEAGERANLVWFRDQLAHDHREGHWNNLARLTLRDELDITQRLLTISVMKHDKNEKDVAKLIEKWMADNSRIMGRWDRLLTMLHSSNALDYTMFFIAIRELIGLLVAGAG